MIKANELRIGNLLITRTDTVTQIRGGGIAAIESGQLVMQPIPLTPEWLERCGYEKHDNKYYHGESYLNNLGPIELVRIGEWCLVCLGLRGRNLKYLHEFQNLIFALIGEELTINYEHLQTTS